MVAAAKDAMIHDLILSRRDGYEARVTENADSADAATHSVQVCISHPRFPSRAHCRTQC